MELPFIILIGSTFGLLLLSFLFYFEDRAARPLVLARTRALLTRAIERMHDRVFRVHPYASRGFFRLIMHYALHGVLKRCLRLLRRIETGLEQLMRQNRQVAKTIDAEKRQNHLTAIADHKLETALSPREKQRRRAHT